jgi:hypothetical protein
MDDAEKRRRKNEYQRIWRARKKDPNNIIEKPELVVDTDVSALKYKPKKARPAPLKDITVNTYISKLRAFHKRMTGLPLSDNVINAINGDEYDKKAVQDEFKYLYSKIDEIKEKELKAIPNLCKIFTKITGFVKLIKILTPIKRNIEIAQAVRRNETTINEEDMISFDKQELLKNANEKLTDDYEKIMYLLMTLIPTRRLDDYRQMTYGKSEGNYFDDENMYIKSSSTKNKKGITIKIPTEIIDIIPHTGYILGYEYKQSALSVKFASVMEKVYKKKIGALALRRMCLTDVNNSGASYLERKDIADAVGNSIIEGIKYSMKVIPKVQEEAQAQVQDE